MKRRDFLTTLVKNKKQNNYPFNPPSEKGLAPYTGDWTFQEASHLLRRTTLGPSWSLMNEAVANGLNATIDQLLDDQPLPSPPLNYDYENDPTTPIGESWIGKHFTDPYASEINNSRRRSLLAWNSEVIFNEGLSITEKMTLFWHNHFVVAVVGSTMSMYEYISLLRSNALGNFKQLTKDMTIDPEMLYYLNGNQNRDTAPNENYARELLELFTVGKGPLIGPGDYSNYTEQDVSEIARALTGWQVKNRYPKEEGLELEAYFNPNRHDTGTKQLSHHFGNATIANNDENEYQDVVDIIFQQEVVSKFIIRKIYRYFVYYDITPTVETSVIEPLAQILRDNDYNIKPVLETLFKSEHFFDGPSMGCMIKNPIDFLANMYKQLDWPVPSEVIPRYKLNIKFSYWQDTLGMRYFYCPQVAGWKAYYQSPSYHRIFINPLTYQARNQFKNVATGNGFLIDSIRYEVDFIAFVEQFDHPNLPNDLVEQIALYLLPLPLTESLMVYLKEVLIGIGLPDFEWTMEYENFLANPNDDELRESVEKKISNLVKAIMELPEYQLS